MVVAGEPFRGGALSAVWNRTVWCRELVAGAAQLLCRFRLRHLVILFAIFALAGCAAKRGRYDVPVVPLPDNFKMPMAVVAADTRSLPASARADSKVLEAPVSGPAEDQPKIEKRMVKTTAAMLSDAFFKFDSDQLTPEAEAALNSVAEILRNAGYSGNIHLTGHTCNIGTAQYNQKLSERRALSIRKYLAGTGVVPLDAIVAEGLGENNPRYPNTKESRYKNRRVDLEFVTFTEKLEDVTLPSEPARAGTAKQKVEWEREYIDSEPAWLSPAPQDIARQAVATDGGVAVPASLGSAEAPAAPVTPLANVLAEWWRLLGSSELDALMDRVLANNHDLRVAAYRVAQARARAEQASADRTPVISLPVEVGIQAPYYGVGTVVPGGQITSKKTYKAGIRGDMRADIWGERQALYESADFQLWNATFQRDEAQRKLIANVVSTYVDYLSSNDRLRVAHETAGVLSGMVASAEQRMEKGDATIIDVEQMRTAVHAVRATIPVLKLRREQALNEIAVQAGTVPGNLVLSGNGLDTLLYPSVLPGVPSALLLRRPDVRAVEARLLTADADLDVARTRVLPPLDLSAQVGSGSFALSQWFQPHTMYWSAIANLSATIFDNGKLSNEVNYTNAVHEEMVESYVRVIYGAVREVEDALVAVQMVGKRLEAEQEAVNAAERAWKFSDEAYSAGAIDYLTLLDTERTYHRYLDDLHGIRMDRYQSLVDLFVALGGGVQQGSVLPGDGRRPAPLVEDGSVSVAAPQALPLDGVDFTNSRIESDGEEVWLAELPAVHDSISVGATWRDLQGRFPELMANRFLLPRQQGRVEDDEQERAAWYRLFIARFGASDEAGKFCAELASRMVRCRVVSSRAKDFTEGSAVPPKAPVLPVPQSVAKPGATATPGTEGTPIREVDSEPAYGAGAAVSESAAVVAAVPPAAVEHGATAIPNATDTPVQEEEAKPASGTEAAVSGNVMAVAYAVQLGTFTSWDKASKAAFSWQKKGYPAYVYEATGSDSRSTWFTVRAGNFDRRDDAAALAASVNQKEKVRALPVVNAHRIEPDAPPSSRGGK